MRRQRLPWLHKANKDRQGTWTDAWTDMQNSLRNGKVHQVKPLTQTDTLQSKNKPL